MAERRMFAKTIVLSDAFLDMPMTTRNLYFTLGMVADDDGFVNNPRSIMRQIGASDGDMKELLSKKFVLLFESGVIVIKHWRINNYLQKDRYKETKYLEEKAQLSLDQNGSYHVNETDDPVYTESVYTDTVYTQDRLGKDRVRLGEDRLVQEKDNNNSIFLSEKNSAKNSADDPDHDAQIKYWQDRLEIFKRQGFETDGIYAMAEANGVSREEIDSDG